MTPTLVVRGRTIDLSQPVLMGIVNATPDSPADGDGLPDPDSRVARAKELVAQGATIVDVGCQSSTTGGHGGAEVEAAEEIARVVPVVAGIRSACPDVVIAVDTRKPRVVEAVLVAGAGIVNDMSGLLHPEVADLCAAADAGLVIVHHHDDDAAAEVVGILADRLAEVTARGVKSDAVILGPGPDFARTPQHTVQVLRDLDALRSLGRPVLLALSRELARTLAAVEQLADRPGTILRAHDVAAVADYLAVRSTLTGRTELAPDTILAPELRREPRP